MDVPKKSISVCVRIRPARDKFQTKTAVFGTFTKDLEHMAEWLRGHKVQHVARESTGVYWKPVWNHYCPRRLGRLSVLTETTGHRLSPASSSPKWLG